MVKIVKNGKIAPEKSAPNHPGKGLDPTTTPPNGQCPHRGGAKLKGASLMVVMMIQGPVKRSPGCMIIIMVNMKILF